ncbi:MAG: SGNH/GDSL hydrolase family protein [Lentisphaerae bacterium]|nr:SGNH/GDSL hydrolase family protein [Lentisphaerota bacterium]
MSSCLCWARTGFYILSLAAGLLLAGCEESGDSHLGDGHDFGINNPYIYLAMGDSITEGYGVDNYAETYVPRLSAMLEKTVVNQGQTGEMSDSGAARVNGVLQRYQPGYLLILYGANDVIHMRSVGFTLSNLRSMIAAANNNKTIPVIATLTPVFGSHAAFQSGVVRLNEQIRILADELDVPLVDLDVAFAWDAQYMQADGLHPNPLGHELMALTFYDVVQ